jgi:hypothetical protein
MKTPSQMNFKEFSALIINGNHVVKFTKEILTGVILGCHMHGEDIKKKEEELRTFLR